MITESEIKNMKQVNPFEVFQYQLFNYYRKGWITKELYIKYSEDM